MHNKVNKRTLGMGSTDNFWTWMISTAINKSELQRHWKIHFAILLKYSLDKLSPYTKSLVNLSVLTTEKDNERLIGW